MKWCNKNAFTLVWFYDIENMVQWCIDCTQIHMVKQCTIVVNWCNKKYLCLIVVLWLNKYGYILQIINTI